MNADEERRLRQAAVRGRRAAARVNAGLDKVERLVREGTPEEEARALAFLQAFWDEANRR